MKKIGLVIQGPLISHGRTGDRVHLQLEKLGADGLVHFDCRTNIQNVIHEFGHLFDSIVVSTWENEVRPGDGWAGATLVSRPDPGGIKQPHLYKDDNKYRQFVGLLNGVLELEKQGADYVVKIRTDQYVDLKKLLEVVRGDTERGPGVIYVPILNAPTFFIHDLYFAGEVATIKELCDAVLAYDKFEFIHSVHREIILKHAYVVYKSAIGMPDWAYFPKWPPDGVCAETRAVFQFMFSTVYRPLGEEVFRSAFWRGSRFSEEHVDLMLRTQDAQPRKYDLPAFMTIDWERYFHFRAQVYGENPTLYEKSRARIGSVAWAAWNLLRKGAGVARAGIVSLRPRSRK